MNRGGSRLRFSCVLRIALSGLWARPVRLILTIALSLMAFVLTGCAGTLALYEEDTAPATPPRSASPAPIPPAAAWSPKAAWRWIPK